MATRVLFFLLIFVCFLVGCSDAAPTVAPTAAPAAVQGAALPPTAAPLTEAQQESLSEEQFKERYLAVKAKYDLPLEYLLPMLQEKNITIDPTISQDWQLSMARSLLIQAEMLGITADMFSGKSISYKLAGAEVVPAHADPAVTATGEPVYNDDYSLKSYTVYWNPDGIGSITDLRNTEKNLAFFMQWNATMHEALHPLLHLQGIKLTDNPTKEYNLRTLNLSVDNIWGTSGATMFTGVKKIGSESKGNAFLLEEQLIQALVWAEHDADIYSELTTNQGGELKHYSINNTYGFGGDVWRGQLKQINLDPLQLLQITAKEGISEAANVYAAAYSQAFAAEPTADPLQLIIEHNPLLADYR